MVVCVQFMTSLLCYASDTPRLPMSMELTVNNSTAGTRLLIDRFVD